MVGGEYAKVEEPLAKMPTEPLIWTKRTTDDAERTNDERWDLQFTQNREIEAPLVCRLQVQKTRQSMPVSQDPRKEVKNPLFWRDIVCEFVCTFMLLCGHTAVSLTFGPSPVSLLQAGIAMGFLVYVIIDGLGHFSGAHMNPIISWCFAMARDISLFRALLYTMAQCVGGIAGSAFVYCVTPPEIRPQIAPLNMDPRLSLVQGFFVEVLLSFILIMATLGVTDKVNREVYVPYLPIGLCVAVDIIIMGQFTGGSMNPALTLGPSVIARKWGNHWVYWAGPYAGCTLAVILYKYIFALLQKKYQTTDDKDTSQINEETLRLLAKILQDKKSNSPKKNGSKKAVTPL